VSLQLEALRRHLGESKAPARAADAGGAVVIGSGKGGVGTSTIASLLALLAAAQGVRTLLVDSDESVGPLAMMLGVDAASGWTTLRASGADPRALLIPLGADLQFLPGGSNGSAESLTPAERRVLFRRVATLYASFDLVVVDGGSRLDPVLAACGAGLARLLTVTTADRIALAASYALVKAVESRHAGVAMEMIVNHSDPTAAEGPAAQMEQAAQNFLGRSVALAAAVPDDPALRAATQAGMCLQDAADGSPAAASLQGLALRLVREPEVATTPTASRYL
jgi:flagellar biosynthesis protein FlhG